MIDRTVTVSCKPAGTFEGEPAPEYPGQSDRPDPDGLEPMDREQPESEGEEVSDAPAD